MPAKRMTQNVEYYIDGMRNILVVEKFPNKIF